MTQHPEIITAPFTIWIAPVGTAFPAMSAAPGAPWRLLGTSGARNYDAGGVVLASSQQWISAPPPAGQTASTATAMESEELRVRLDLIDLTLEQFALVMGNNAVTTFAPAVGVPGYRKVGLSIGPGNAEEFALLVRGPSPYNEDLPAQFELPRACEVGSPQPVFGGGSPARLAVEFKLLPDAAATSDAERFGRLIAGDVLPLPPVFTELPSIAGTPEVGEIVTLDFGTATGSTFSAARLLSGGDPVSFTGTSYLIGEGDLGGSLVLEVDESNLGGTTTAVSAAFGPVTLSPGFVTGESMVVAGDSRAANGINPQAGSAFSRSTGMTAATRLHSITDALLRRAGYPVEIVGDCTFGGTKSSQIANDHMMEIMFARLQEGDVIDLLVGTNDVVDYTVEDPPALGPIPFGDPDVDPAFQPRVGDREPSGTGIGQQGTTIGNLDKLFRAAEARGIIVYCREIVTENASRRLRNRMLKNWLLAQRDLGRYPNVRTPDTYNIMLVDPATATGPIELELVRNDIKGDGTKGSANELVFLHPVHGEAEEISEAEAADPEFQAMFAGKPSLVLLPNGSNDSSFLNTNPAMRRRAGNGVLGYPFSNTPLPTGEMPEGWSIGHSITGGTLSIVCSFDEAGDLVVTINRTGGASAAAVNVQLRGTPVTITPEVGKRYNIEAQIVAPARPALDLFAIEGFINAVKEGLVDEYGQDISNVRYGAMLSNEPNPYAKDGGTFTIHGVAFEMTPAVVASAGGTLTLEPRFNIRFPDNINTGTNGPLVVKFKCGGLRERNVAKAFVAPPARPLAGPASTAAPRIDGLTFVGSSASLVDGTFASGSITARRFLKDGALVTYPGSSYTYTEADVGKYFLIENVATGGGGTTTVSSQMVGPVTAPSAELVALMAALAGKANNAIFDFRTARINGTTWETPDWSGNGNTARQTFAIRQPGIDAALGAIFTPGEPHCMGYPWQGSAPSTVTVLIALRKSAASTVGRLLSDQTSSNNAGNYSSGNGTALVGTFDVDNTLVSPATRGGFFTVLHATTDEVIVKGEFIPVSAWAALYFGAISSTFGGSMRAGVVIDDSTTTRTDAISTGITFLGGTPPPPPPPPPESPGTFVASSSGGVTTGSSITVSAPAGAATGDLLVAYVAGASGGMPDTPAGWTAGPQLSGHAVFTRAHDGSANYTFTVPTTTGLGVILLAYADAAYGAGGSWSGAANDPVAASITSPSANSLNLVLAGAFNAANTYTVPSGFTLRGVLTTARSLVVLERDTAVGTGSTTAQTVTRSAGSTTGRALQITLSPA